MEPHAPLFPSFVAPLSDLYGASSFRVAEAHAYAHDMDELDREELALELTVRALVDRKAPPPIGLAFHRAKTAAANASYNHNSSSNTMNQSASHRLQRGGVGPPGSEGSRLGSGVQTTRGYHGHVAEDDVEEDEEDEEEMEEEEDEDDLEELDDEEEGEEAEQEDDELFPEDEEDEEDDGAREDDDSMDMSM